MSRTESRFFGSTANPNVLEGADGDGACGVNERRGLCGWHPVDLYDAFLDHLFCALSGRGEFALHEPAVESNLLSHLMVPRERERDQIKERLGMRKFPCGRF